MIITRIGNNIRIRFGNETYELTVNEARLLLAHLRRELETQKDESFSQIEFAIGNTTIRSAFSVASLLAGRLSTVIA